MTSSGQLSMPLTEEYRIGQRILSGLTSEELRSAYLDALDAEMVKRARRRETRQVTPDEVRELLESWNPPPPEMLSRSFLGGLWQRRHWQTDGQTYTSATKGSHGNRLLIWRLDERLYRERGES